MNGLACAQVEERDLQARYLAGTLPQEEGEAYEAHYFGCDRCWPSLQRALELRAAHLPSSAATRRGFGWRVLAAAAVLVVAVGLWRAGWISDARSGWEHTVRGQGDTLAIHTAVVAGRFTAYWPPVPDADVYRARLFASDGTVLFEREVSDTIVGVVRDAVPHLAHPDAVYWDIEALNRVRAILARSGLVPAAPPK